MVDPVAPTLRAQLAAGHEFAWFQPSLISAADGLAASGIDAALVDEAEARLLRWAPWIAATFPDTQPSAGIVESELRDLPTLAADLPGRLFAKLDSHLPVSGSVKARGGLHEVLQYAESLGMTPEHPVAPEGAGIAVGSTGNLGLSIGIVGAALGLRATVHMSREASQWKKDLLRAKGARVVEHDGDFTAAVAAGRREAAREAHTHFVDDENSRALFAGYAVAGRRLAAQLRDAGIPVDLDRPLLVALPCGIGGAPGGITYGLKHAFGDAVRVFFVEPTQAPCMSLGVATGLHDGISVTDIGLSGRTLADGLAVGRPSGFVGQAVGALVDGFVTVDDAHLLQLRAQLEEAEGIRVEPSAAAGFAVWPQVLAAADYRERAGLADERLANATFLTWLTGGGMVPDAEFARWELRESQPRGVHA